MLIRLVIIFSLLLPFFSNALEIKTFTLVDSSELRASAIDHNIAWVAGSNNSIYKSIDSGKTWINSSLNTDRKYDFRDIEIIDFHTAIVMASGTGTESALFITRDQGEHWHLLYENPDELGFFNSIVFIDKNLGFLMGDPVHQHFMIKRTTDGGSSWHTVDMAEFPKRTHNEIAFAASGNTLFALKPQQIVFATGGKQANIYHFNHETNISRKTSVSLHSQTDTSGTYSIAKNNKGDLFALGGDYKNRQGSYENIVIFSKHGKPEDQIVNIGGLVTAMQCAGHFCIAVGKTNSYFSTNDGYQWQAIQNQDFKGFYTLAQSNGVFIAAGSKGKVAVVRQTTAKMDLENKTK